MYSTATGKRIRMLGRLESVAQGELDVAMDAAGQHLLVYTGSHRVRMMNLATGQLASISPDPLPRLPVKLCRLVNPTA